MMNPRHYAVVFGALMVVAMMVDPSVTSGPDREVHLGVIGPESSSFVPIHQVLTAVGLAVHNVMSRYELSNGYQLRFSFLKQGEDWNDLESRLTTAHDGGSLDAIVGPVDRFVSSVAALGQRWNIPVVSLGTEFLNATVDESPPLLTRAGPVNFISMATMFVQIMERYNWNKIKLIYQEGQDDFTSMYCADGMRVLSAHLERQGIDTEVLGTREETIPVTYIQPGTRRQHSIIALCASRESVRDLMIQAHRLNMDNGDYVFFNIDIFSSNARPWFSPSDTEDRNMEAASAYQAVQTITMRKPLTSEYRMFSLEVKRRTIMMYQNSVIGEGPVNPFVGYFHDAIILYSLALKETLDAHLPVSDGRHITSQMTNRSFQGITGTVTMDTNGVRVVDHSLLAKNPASESFQEVATYFGNTQQLVPVQGVLVYWAGGRSSPPSDEVVNPNSNQETGALSLLTIITNVVIGCLALTLT